MVWSPRKVNVCCELWLLTPLELEAEELPLLLACNIVQGTATCLLLLAVADAPEVDEVELVPELLPDELNWTTANSTLPDCGLMITSLIVPTEVPDDPWIWAPLS